MDIDSLSLMQAYLRAQAERSGLTRQKLDWFFEQSAERAELCDDGIHPLLEDSREPHYSREVCDRALATWAMLDNKNPFKFVCDYYHTLEKLGENSPAHVREYVRRSLVAPSTFSQHPEHILSQVQANRMDYVGSSPAYHYHQNCPVACFYRHQHTDSNHLRSQMMQSDNRNMGIYRSSYNDQYNTGHNVNGNMSFGRRNYVWGQSDFDNGALMNSGHQNMAVPKQVTGVSQGVTGVKQVIRGNQVMEETAQRMGAAQQGTNGEGNKIMESLALNLFGPNEDTSVEPALVGSPSRNDKTDEVALTQTSAESTPSKASEADSCYQSISSPLTDHEE